MTYAREHIENMILERLCDVRTGDLPDDAIESDFKMLIPAIEVAVNKVLWQTNIPIFTEDDLTSFMYLKAHQILRRQLWDRSKSPYSFFYVAFQNLMRDIVKSMNGKRVSEQMEWDVLEVAKKQGVLSSMHLHEEWVVVHNDEAYESVI